MVAVENDFARGDICDSIKTRVLLHFHADGEARAVALSRFYAHQVRIVFAESLVGLELHAQRFARALALERVLERFEELAVADMEVCDVGSRLQLHTLCVVHLDAQRDHGVPCYDRRRLTTSKTSAAWPRGLTT